MSANGRKLFLGGLTKTTTTEQLFEIFGRFGQVVDAVVMERNGAPRGFGFVTFKEKASLSEVLAKGVTIDGREVDVKRAVPEEEMAFAPSKVFVGGLSQKVDKAALKEHFEQFGEVRDAVVMIDRATSRSRGFGFVRFSAPEAVARVLAQPQMIDGQYVDVKRAEPADSLPPPQYPRTRGEEKDEGGKARRRRRGKRAGPGSGTVTPQELEPGAPQPALDVAAANYAMWASLLSLGGMPQAQPAYPFPFGAFPGAPPAGIDMSALFPAVPSFDAPRGLRVKTDLDDAPQPSGSPFGDVSNILASRNSSPEKADARAVSPPLPFAKRAGVDLNAGAGVDLAKLLGPENKPGLALQEMNKAAL